MDSCKNSINLIHDRKWWAYVKPWDPDEGHDWSEDSRELITTESSIYKFSGNIKENRKGQHESAKADKKRDILEIISTRLPPPGNMPVLPSWLHRIWKLEIWDKEYRGRFNISYSTL